jgi:XTP/dITP diphosphohydrolase
MTHTTRILVVGTRNAKKCREMAHALQGLPVQVRPLSDYDPVPPAVEDADTFEANAAIKALAYARATGQWCVADDSGLEVAALDDRPGVYSARWGGEDGNDALNNRRLMDELRGVPRERRQAQFVCVAVLASPERVLLEARGTCEGLILDAPRGQGGFGYDPYFFVPHLGRTMAELTPDEKLAVSHRGRALADLRARIAPLLA